MTSPLAGSLAFLRRRADVLAHRILRGIAAVLRALPSRWILPLGDRLGTVLYALDRRGRRVGRENLRVVFGDALTEGRRRRILLASFRNNVRSIALLLHVSPMTRERMRAWVDVPEELFARAHGIVADGRGVVLVSGHVGTWELLLGLPTVFDGAPEMMFLAEPFWWDPLDHWLADLRGSGGGSSALRHGGARALNSHLRRGGVAALLADRNVRRREGGVWAPFLGLRTRTTPLPAWLAIRNQVPLLPVFCLPHEGGRYRFWAGPDLTAGVDTGDRDAALLEVTTRINHVLETTIRAQPEIWNWTLKRFKSRPDLELGPYPSYSLWDP